MEKDRRHFIKKVLLGGTALAAFPGTVLNSTNTSGKTGNIHNGEIKIALIGAGGMGSADTYTALSVDGVRLVAVCDLYDARLTKAKNNWGQDIFVTKNYKEVLALKDVDAVIVATPDHWHQPIAIDAMEAGKHVYCEKPVIHKVQEGTALISAQQKTEKIFQTGSQGMTSLGNNIARLLIQAGILGKVNYIDGQFTAPPGRIDNYPIPEDASEKTIWWDQFLGKAPKIAYDPQKFFYWRNWKEYGTGLAGDLFVHVIASVHYIMDTLGPDKIYTTGGIRHYTAGYQNTPDVMLGYFDYPDKKNLGAFTLSLGANMVDGISQKWGSTDFKIIGEKGSMDVTWDKVTLKCTGKPDTSLFSSLDEIKDRLQEPAEVSPKEYVFTVKEGYRGAHYEHFYNFFQSIQNKTPLIADTTYGVRSAAVALLSYESCEQGKPIYWDAEKMKVKNK